MRTPPLSLDARVKVARVLYEATKNDHRLSADDLRDQALPLLEQLKVPRYEVPTLVREVVAAFADGTRIDDEAQAVLAAMSQGFELGEPKRVGSAWVERRVAEAGLPAPLSAPGPDQQLSAKTKENLELVAMLADYVGTGRDPARLFKLVDRLAGGVKRLQTTSTVIAEATPRAREQYQRSAEDLYEAVTREGRSAVARFRADHPGGYPYSHLGPESYAINGTALEIVLGRLATALAA